MGLLLALPIWAQSESVLQSRLDSLSVLHGYPGVTCSMIFADGRQVNLASGYADLELKIPMKPTDRMFSGSTGKTFVSAIAMQLIDEGKLDPETYARTYFEDEAWFSKIPNQADMQVKHLLTHTSGLPRYAFKSEYWEVFNQDRMRNYPPQELLTFVMDEGPLHPVGEAWAYSDTGYLIIGLILEKICGKPYFDILRERILKPFHLDGITPSQGREFKDLVNGYTGDHISPYDLPPKTVVDGKYIFNPEFEYTGGGVVTSAPDLARWTKMLYEGEIFSAERLKELLSPVDFTTGQPAEYGYGYGVFVYQTPMGKAYGHTGFFFGYETAMLYFPNEKVTIVLQVNADSTAGKMKVPILRFVNEFLSGIL